ncbi:MAG TPA: glycosyltransferase family 39 protein [Bryobacteraceae bacterium]|nr:glycosyltransferase family 39 protein [Bryobacteraceae bacterium]
MTNRHRFLVWGLLTAYTVLALAAALTYTPRADEGFFASPGLNLATKGHMGTTVLEGSHDFLKNINRHTYWITPLHFIAQAAWYKVVGFSLLNLRLLSILFGLVALLAWYAIAMRVSERMGVAALTVALVAFDFNFIVGGSSGRMDMMAAALNFCGIAAYLLLRERSLSWAVLVGNAFATAAGLTHPVAGYLAVAAQVFLTLYFDWRRVRLSVVALAAVPYLIGGTAWGLYILKDADAFLAQFGTNAKMGGRLDGIRAPWMGIWHEVTWRYFAGYGLGNRSTGVSGPAHLKALLLGLYALGVAGAALSREVRGNKGYRALLWLALIYFLLLSVMDAQKAYYYLPHITPLYAALTAAWLAVIMRQQRVPAWAPAAAVGTILAVQAGGVALRAWQNPYGRTYEPAVAFLREHARPNDTILGNASLAFELGFDGSVVDDVRLGYYSGRRPDFVVLDQEYLWSIRRYKTTDPPIFEFIERRLTTDYSPVYDRAGYQILVSHARLARQTAPIANAAEVR